MPVGDEAVRNRDDHQSRPWQVAAEALEHILERRHHENHDHRGDDEGNHQDRDRVEHRAFELGLDGLDFFLVGRQAVEQGIENTGLLAGLDQIAEQGIEIQRIFAKGRGQTGAGLDIGLDRRQQPGQSRIVGTLADDIEGLQQRHA
jgi:hypothetical protein